MSESIYAPQDEMSLWYLGNPAVPRKVGLIKLVDAKRGVSLRYDMQWLREGFALSEDLPLIDQDLMPSEKARAAGAVNDARPDRWGERVIRALDAPARLSLMEFLYFAGDDRFGALGVSLALDEYKPRGSSPLPTFEDADRIHRLVQDVAHGIPVPDRDRRLLQPGRTLGGAKPKSIVMIDGRQWVLKFADEYDFDWPVIEHATMDLARQCGLHVARTQTIGLGPGKSAIAVERFDRLPQIEGGESHRVHALSMDVALRAACEEMGYPEMAGLLRRIGGAHSDRDRRELFARMVFNILVDNTDDHEKNHALLRDEDGAYSLSPAFDVVPALTNLGTQQIRVGRRGNEASLENALSESAQFGLSPDEAIQIVRHQISVISGWTDVFRQSGVSDRDIEAAAPYLDGDKKAMRDAFLQDFDERPVCQRCGRTECACGA